VSLTLCKRITPEGLANNTRQQTLSSTISVTLAFGAADFEKDMDSKNMYIASTRQRRNVNICTCPLLRFLMPNPEPAQLADFSAILNLFDNMGYSIPDLLLALLTQRRFKKSTYTSELLRRSAEILSALLSHSGLPRDAELATSKALHPMYAREIQYLVKPSSGWNFSAQTVMPDDIDDFDISDMIQDTTDNAPMVSALLDTLLSSKRRCPASDADVAMAATEGLGSDTDADEGEDQGEAMLEGTPLLTAEERDKRKQGKRKGMLLKIVRKVLSWPSHPIRSY
jgi:hypothetical protein